MLPLVLMIHYILFVTRKKSVNQGKVEQRKLNVTSNKTQVYEILNNIKIVFFKNSVTVTICRR